MTGATTNQGAIVNARLESMRRQVLSKEFWMADDTCRNASPLRQLPFQCLPPQAPLQNGGCIFDSKCTSIISGQKFGVAGSLARVQDLP